ncbi:hypothetical protein AB0M19_32360 [Streptomyces sp. NPDC051920]|uniref:hypothetical protein n=1 Tax=Streptomyces sp. NPDC051920 TaxID=3155523 RepID=UPI0034139653
MPKDPALSRLGTEARSVKFPDGSRGVILVRAGIPQNEAEALAARIWADRADSAGPTVDLSAAVGSDRPRSSQ